MGKDRYRSAHRAGMREYHKALSEGRYPYPPALEDIAPGFLSGRTENVGITDIPIADIAGTAAKDRQDAFSYGFLPLLDETSEFADKWCTLFDSLAEEGLRDPVIVYEYLKRFYVLEGNKRLSVSIVLGAVDLPAQVTRVLPAEDVLSAHPAYGDFLRFFRLFPTYEIDCVRADGYSRLLKVLGRDTVTPFSAEEKSLLLSAYRAFYAALHDRDAAFVRMAAGDAFVTYLEVYGSDLTSLPGYDELLRRIGRLRGELTMESSGAVAFIETPETGERDTFAYHAFPIFKREAQYTPEHPLKVAFLHERTPGNSAWVYGHELGRNHLSKAFAGSVVSTARFSLDTDDALSAAVDEAVSEGARIIFTTSPLHMTATLRCAIHYPQIRFFNCSVNLPRKTVRTYETRLYEAKFLMGALAASYARDHRIGYVADVPLYGAVANINAFAAGAAMIDPYVRIDLTWSALSSFTPDHVCSFTDADVFSGPDLKRPEYFSREFGVYLRGEDGSITNLAMPLRDWGRYYELLLRRSLSGASDNVPSDSAINYWWGMESRVVDVLLGAKLDTPSRRLIGTLSEAVSSGRLSPFDTGDRALSNMEIIGMDELAGNVCGTVPGSDELNDVAKRLTEIAGLPVVRKDGT